MPYMCVHVVTFERHRPKVAAQQRENFGCETVQMMSPRQVENNRV